MSQRPHQRVPALALVVAALNTVLANALGCRESSPTTVVDAGIVVAASTNARPPVDAAKVLAVITEKAPSVDVSIATRGDASEVGLELRGQAEPLIAIALLSSLPERVPGTRVSKIELAATTWRATVTTTNAPPATPSDPGGDADPTSLGRVALAIAPAFTGDQALFASGAVDVTAARIAMNGELAKGRTIGDAADAIAPGYALMRVDAGPPFILEIAPVK